MSFGSGSFGSTAFGANNVSTVLMAASESLRVAENVLADRFLLLRELLIATETQAATVAPGVNERLQLNEQLANNGAFGADIFNGAYMHDEPLLAWLLLAAEGLQLSDTSSGNLRAIPAVADLLVATGAVDTHLDAQAAIATALAVDDMAASGWNASTSDSAQLLEALSVRLDASMAAVEAALVSDAVTDVLRIFVLLSDTASAVDAASAIGVFSSFVNDEASIFASIRLGGGEYSAWVLNTETNAPSEYRNFAFNSMVEFNGRYYGATDDGIYELDVGDDDEGASIPAWVRTGLSSLGSGKMKRLPSMYLGYKSDGTLVLKVVTTGERGTKQEDWYQLTAQTSEDMREGRIKLGKGLKSVYWAFEIHNKSGSDFELDNITLYPLILERRV